MKQEEESRIITSALFYVSISIFCLSNIIWLKTLSDSKQYYLLFQALKEKGWTGLFYYKNGEVFEEKYYPLSNHFIWFMRSSNFIAIAYIYMFDCCSSHSN